MKTTLRIFFTVMIGFVLLMGSVWAKEEMRQSGFLTDYSKLKQDDPLKAGDWVYVNKNVNFGAYDKIILKHVAFFLKEDSEYKGIQADEMNELAKAFHEEVVEALSDVYTFTDKPGPGVMVIRYAVTDLVPNKPVRGTITSILPSGIVLSHLKKLGTGTHIGMGGASLEGEILDSLTNEVLIAVVDTETGKKYRIDKSVSEWGQTKEIFEDWAEGLRKRLDSVSNRK
jgi:hypothetical protein